MFEVFWNEALLGYSVPQEDRTGPFQATGGARDGKDEKKRLQQR
jgi:hypothetical protein